MSPGDGPPLVGIGDYEAVAVAMHGQTAGDQVLLCGGVFRQSVAVAPGLDQAGALHQSLQSFGELLPLLAAQVHLTNQLLVASRVVRLALDMPQDSLIGEHEVSTRHPQNTASRHDTAMRAEPGARC